MGEAHRRARRPKPPPTWSRARGLRPRALPRSGNLFRAEASASDRSSEKAAKACANCCDQEACERDDAEGAYERVREEAPAEVGEHQQLERNHRDREDEGDVVVRDEERQRVQDAAEERPTAGD